MGHSYIGHSHTGHCHHHTMTGPHAEPLKEQRNCRDSNVLVAGIRVPALRENIVMVYVVMAYVVIGLESPRSMKIQLWRI